LHAVVSKAIAASMTAGAAARLTRARLTRRPGCGRLDDVR
jgi:hypothetical protein